MTGINRFGANLNVNVARLGNVNAANAYKAVQKEAESLKMNLNKVDCFVKTTETQQVAKEEVQDMKKAKGKGKGKGKFKEKWKKFWHELGEAITLFFIKLAGVFIRGKGEATIIIPI